MTKKALQLVASFSGMMICVVAFPETWSVVNTDVPGFKKQITVALIQNETGHKLGVYRLNSGGAVWAIFSPPVYAEERLSTKLPPIYQIDRFAPVEVKNIPLFKSRYSLTPSDIQFQIWHGPQNSLKPESFVQLMEGERLKLNYFLWNDDQKEAGFTLQGAALALSKALDISPEINHVLQTEQRELNRKR